MSNDSVKLYNDAI